MLQLLPILALVGSALAMPTPTSTYEWSPALAEFYTVVDRHIQEARAAPGFPQPPACDLSEAVMPVGPTPLPAPNPGDMLAHVAIGRGVQVCNPQAGVAQHRLIYPRTTHAPIPPPPPSPSAPSPLSTTPPASPHRIPTSLPSSPTSRSTTPNPPPAPPCCHPTWISRATTTSPTPRAQCSTWTPIPPRNLVSWPRRKSPTRRHQLARRWVWMAWGTVLFRGCTCNLPTRRQGRYRQSIG
jgi:hypothetical protein